MNPSPLISVGIKTAPIIEVTLNGPFTTDTGLNLADTAITFDAARPLPFTTLTPAHPEASFTIHNVTIGIDFHWQQLQDQTFRGSLLILSDTDSHSAPTLIAVNRVETEEYLRSVISSEMKADAPLEFLKAHAVISRSWIHAQIDPPRHTHSDEQQVDSPDTRKRWYGCACNDHTRFDVCADDHCQRYQGCTNACTPRVSQAIDETFGLVLTHNGEFCDTRFSKCCGGSTELFSTCWQDADPPYLQHVEDPYCSRATEPVLRSVLNDYDLATRHFFKWQQVYSADTLADIIHRRTGIDFGRIIALTPLHRGPSGRIDSLHIRGTRHSMTIGKELEIRRSLSESHLYSSNFTVTPITLPGNTDGLPDSWQLDGFGWGHGVGLCQIGAAVMAFEGHSFTDILNHYFPGAKLTRQY